MMKKRENILWGCFAAVLVLLFLLSSTDLIIKEKKQEIYPVSIVLGDISEERYASFRKGVDAAAENYNVDVSVITLFEKYDGAAQVELVRREIEDGAAAVIFEPVNPAGCLAALDEAPVGSPLIVNGTALPGDQIYGSVSVDPYEAGRKLGEMAAAENTEKLPVFIFAERLEYGQTKERYAGLLAALEEAGLESVLYERETEDSFRRIIEETVYPGKGKAVIAALDVTSTTEAARIIEDSPVYGNYIHGLYGMGSTLTLLNQLDRGVIRGLVVNNRFDEGYLCVEKAVQAIRGGGARDRVTLDSFYIQKEALRDRQFEKLLYPMD